MNKKRTPGHEKSNVSSKKNKLKNNKLALKAWDKQSFGKTRDRVRICGNKVNEILFKQDLIQMDPLNAELVDVGFRSSFCLPESINRGFIGRYLF